MHPDDREAARLGAVAQDGHGELRPREPGLDQHRLAVGVEKRGHPAHQVGAVGAEVVHGDSLARPLARRLDEDGEGEGAPLGIGHRLRQAEGRGRDAADLEDLLGAALVEGQAEGQRVGGVVGNAVELADGGDVPLAVGAIEPLRDVEDEVGVRHAEPLGKGGVGLEADDGAEGAERVRDGVNGAGFVPLGVEVGLLEVGAE